MCKYTSGVYAVGNKRTILRDNNAIDWVISISTYSLIALIIIIFTFALSLISFARKFNCKFVVFCFNIKNVHNIRTSLNCRMNDNWTQKFNYNLPSSSREREKKIIQKLINYFIDLTTRLTFFCFVSDNFLKQFLIQLILIFVIINARALKEVVMMIMMMGRGWRVVVW